MNKYWLVLIALFIFCCGAPVDEVDTTDDTDLGQVEEALHYQCAPSRGNYLGVDNSFQDWSNQPCNILSPSATCMYPGMKVLGSFVNNGVYPFTLYLGNGWTSAQRGEINPGSIAARDYMTSQLGGACTSGGSSAFALGTSPPSGAYMVLDNAPLGNTLSNNFDWVDANSVLHLACIAGQSVTEPYPMASAVRCTQWRGTVDWVALKTWAAGNGFGTTGVNNAARNLIQKAFAEGMGIGMNPVGTKVDGRELRRNVSQTGWSGDQVAWVCNAAQSESSNILTCI